jgi:peroxiredoxin
MPLKIGDVAPDFELMTQDHTRKVRLGDFRGKKKVVLLFYPMDFSPVCTNEHCAFGPQLDSFAGADTVVFGVSCDSPFTHAAFKKQYGIPYDLLADVGRKVVKAYDLFLGEEPFNCGKRGTVVIGKDGKITHWHEQPTLEERKVEELARAVKS